MQGCSHFFHSVIRIPLRSVGLSLKRFGGYLWALLFLQNQRRENPKSRERLRHPAELQPHPSEGVEEFKAQRKDGWMRGAADAENT